MYHGFNLSNGSKGDTFPISSASSTVKSGSKKNSVLFTAKLKRAASELVIFTTQIFFEKS